MAVCGKKTTSMCMHRYSEYSHASPQRKSGGHMVASKIAQCRAKTNVPSNPETRKQGLTSCAMCAGTAKNFAQAHSKTHDPEATSCNLIVT
mmetsp:Transcript_31826/g.92034  ORF Transcript_31826/g.92034 Transcript_31826/m.92034 type:complete len:91 (+) Transcript_31826:246-518(+)